MALTKYKDFNNLTDKELDELILKLKKELLWCTLYFYACAYIRYYRTTTIYIIYMYVFIWIRVEECMSVL